LQARKKRIFSRSPRLILFNRIRGGIQKGAPKRARRRRGFNACDKSGAPVLRTQCLLFFLLGDLNF
jgi:hypothetical protein